MANRWSPVRAAKKVTDTGRKGSVDVVLECGHATRAPRWLATVSPQLLYRCKECRDEQERGLRRFRSRS